MLPLHIGPQYVMDLIHPWCITFWESFYSIPMHKQPSCRILLTEPLVKVEVCNNLRIPLSKPKTPILFGPF